MASALTTSEMTGTESFNQVRQHDALRFLLEYSIEAVTVIARDGRVLEENAAATHMAGQPLVDRRDRSFFDRVHVDDLSHTRAAIGRAYLSTAPVGPVPCRLRHATGVWHAIEAVVRSFGDETGTRACLFIARDVRDVTPVDAREGLIQSIAHDFNNVLTNILGNAERILDGGLPDAVRPGIVDIRDAATVAASLAERLQAFGQQRPAPTEVVDVCDAIGRMASFLRQMVGPRIRLTVTSAIAGPAHVHLARGSFEQVVMNLIVNARDAMAHGGQLDVTIDRAVVARAGQASRDFVTLRVADTGVGMTPAVRARAFEPYFTTKAVGKGTGLGLPTVHGIVTDAGGSIDVTTEPGRGTTIAVRLPRALPQA
jgi:PAS domain S-box-containing protein